MSDQVWNIKHRRGTDRHRFAQLRHSTIAQPLILPADVDTIRLRIESGIGEGPLVLLDDRLIAPSPGPYTIADIIKNPPLTGEAWIFDTVGANFDYLYEWDSLSADKYEGLRVYRETYEIDCRTAGFSREFLIFNVTVTPNTATIST